MAGQTSGLKLFYQNVRGLRTKTDTFYNNLLVADTDIAIITETWLCDGILDTELCCPDRYDLFRRDRGALGGGVMVACAARLCARRRSDLEHDELECIIIAIPAHTLGSQYDLNIICIYIPPGRALASRTQLFVQFLMALLSSQPDEHFIVVGDFNLPCIDWKLNRPMFLKKGSIETQSCAIELINTTSYFGLSQYNYFLNAYGNVLDLFFSNIPLILKKSSCPLVTEDICHPSIDICIKDILVPSIKPLRRQKNLFRKADYDSINTYISNYDWSFLTSIGLGDAIDTFYSTLNDAISKYVPQKTISHTYSYPIWYSKALVNLMKEKAKYHALWKKYNNPNEYDSFSTLRSRLKKLEKECYTSFINYSQEKIKTTPKLLWTYVKSKRKNKSNYPHIMHYDNGSFSNEHDICNAFNDFFYRNFSPPAQQYSGFSHERSPCYDVISQIRLSFRDTKKMIKNLDCSKGAGCDEIPPYFFVKCADSLATPITIVFNRCFDEGFFPQIWKTANIVPVHKKGTKTAIEHYRPISILNVLSKLMERVVHKYLYPFIIRHIPSQQHGFVHGRSTNTNLAIFTNDVLRGMDDGYQIDVIYTDFEKAFDRVDHIILLRKLQELGIRGNLLRWMESYLRNRSQAVVVAGHRSDFVSVPSGIPQGSILGPLLYASYLYDISSCFRFAKFLMYADDTKIYAYIKTDADTHQLQNDLDSLCKYYRDNRIGVNVSKCTQITFTRKRQKLDFPYTLDNRTLARTNTVKDLGVIFDSKMLMSDHITAMVAKAYKNLGFVLRVSRPFSDPLCIKVLYFSYVRSALEYCSNIWNPNYVTYSRDIEQIQSKFIKFLNYRTQTNKCAYEVACEHHKLMQLKDRRTLLQLMFLHDVCSNRINSPELTSMFLQFRTPHKRTRHATLFHVPFSHSNYAQNSVICRILDSYNKEFSSVDLFYQSKTSVKAQVISVLNSREQK